MTTATHTPVPRYHGIAAQRDGILKRLMQSPATKADLASDCNAPDPTARIHELRKAGYRIATHWFYRTNPDGTVNRVALYSLPQKDERQGELDLIP